MSNHINGSDMTTLTVFKMELQRNTDMKLEIDPAVTEYMKSRILAIETAPPRN
jgi:hypothetical protein